MDNYPARVTAAARYAELQGDRMPYLDRARQASKYTIPWLYPPTSTTPSADLYKPFSSIGARGVNNLASALTLTMLPPGGSFVRFHLKEELARQMQPEERQLMDNALSMYEQSVIRETEERYVRTVFHELAKHLLVAGNCLFYYPPAGDTVRVFGLESFVVRRSGTGAPLEILVRELVSLDDLPKATQLAVEVKLRDSQAASGHTDKPIDRNHELFTWITRNGDKYEVHQEVCGIEVSGSKGTYPKEKCPWLAMRWSRMCGEHYGRSHCDDYIGDLISAEGLTKAIVEMAAMASRVTYLINPNGLTSRDEFLTAENGQPIDGNEGDVHVVKTDKLGDLQIAKAALDGIETRLSYAFILNSAIQRQAERVTAEEIRLMAQQLEQQLGGAYALLSQEFQLPLVELAKSALERNGKLPVLPDKAVKHTVVTGVDALGRSQDLTRLRTFLSINNQEVGPNAVQTLKVSNIQKMVAAAIGLNPSELVMSDEEIAAAQNRATTQALTEKLGPQVISQLGQSQRQAAEPQPQPTGAMNG